MQDLYHYTSVDSLAMILSTRRLRLNSLQRVDDLQEQKSLDIVGLGKYVFVSCWTEECEEQLPMWKMYSNFESGVRIKLQRYPFKEKENLPEDLRDATGEHVEGNAEGRYPRSLITVADMARMKVISTGLVQQRNILFKVDYTSETDKLLPQIIERNDERVKLALDKMGKYKNVGWKFQKEWRYILYLYPLDINNPTEVLHPEKMMYRMMNDEANMPFDHIDLELDEDAFSNMEITLSPKISNGNRLIVNDLVAKYNPKADVSESIFYGTLA